tara:strand:+ start:32 stop:274 length:243 start_codon:yes stop_codon:yes gene_type:complete
METDTSKKLDRMDKEFTTNIDLMEVSISKLSKFVKEDTNEKNSEFKECFDRELRSLRSKITKSIDGITEEREKTLNENSN